MQELMLEFFTSQSPGMRLSFVKYLSKLAVLPKEILDSLRSIRFMLASSGTYQAPEYLIDPLSPIAALFSAPSNRLPSLVQPTFSCLSKLLSELRFLERVCRWISSRSVSDLWTLVDAMTLKVSHGA